MCVQASPHVCRWLWSELVVEAPSVKKIAFVCVCVCVCAIAIVTMALHGALGAVVCWFSSVFAFDLKNFAVHFC